MIHRGLIGLVVVALVGVSACGGKSAQTGSTSLDASRGSAQAGSTSVDGSSGQEVSDSTTGSEDGDAGLAFDCGGTSTCDGHTQVCEHVQGGVPPGVDYFACIPIPSGCDGGASCACLIGALRGRGATACSGSAGELTVEIDVP